MMNCQLCGDRLRKLIGLLLLLSAVGCSRAPLVWVSVGTVQSISYNPSGGWGSQGTYTFTTDATTLTTWYNYGVRIGDTLYQCPKWQVVHSTSSYKIMRQPGSKHP